MVWNKIKIDFQKLPASPPICTDCMYHRISILSEDLCDYNSLNTNSISIVTGKRKVTIDKCNKMRFDHDQCGVDGKWFSQKTFFRRFYDGFNEFFSA